MGHHSAHGHDFSKRAGDFFLSPRTEILGGVSFGILLGLIALVLGAMHYEAKVVWAAVLLNNFFFFSIALGGVAFSGMQDVVDAVWARPIKRIHESFASFLPISAGIFVVFLICVAGEWAQAHTVFDWIADEHTVSVISAMVGKNVWLQKNFMVTRNLVALALILILSRWQLGMALKRDAALLAGQGALAKELGEKVHATLKYWSAPVLIVYALCFTLISFDLMMSLSPLWFSTLWAGWMFAIMMQTLCAMILIFMFALRSTGIGSVIERQQFHDVGKLLHGFTIFFAYLTYAHVLTYWYGNVPEETEYFILRIDRNFPWLKLVIGIPLFAFVIPFFTLILKQAKWTAAITVPLCLGVLVAQWFTMILVVMPQVITGTKWKGPLLELGIFAMILSLFLASIFWFGKRYPMVAIADPLLPKSYEMH